MKNDVAMRNEVGHITFGILNYLDRHYKTSQIWEVEEPWKMLQAPIYKELEAECVKVK